ncbi:hypothetical protein [Streptomyces sp. enrichment culture]|uniref:hypothetical protein n=1 Tax=Streptomyces sp. enrichment culture TaxID=1795815 RepID=UPI003F564390
MAIPQQRSSGTFSSSAPTAFNSDSLKASLAGAGAGVGLAALIDANDGETLAGKAFLYLCPLFAVILSAIFEWVLITLDRMTKRKRARARLEVAKAALADPNIEAVRKEELTQVIIQTENEAIEWGIKLHD